MIQLLIVYFFPGLVLDNPIWGSGESGRFLAAAVTFIFNYACYFSDNMHESSSPVPGLTFSQKRKMLKTGLDLQNCPLRIGPEGLITLDSFVRSDIAEHAYMHSGKSFLYFLGCCNDARMEYELTCQPLQHVNDNDMYETVMKYVAHRFRGKSISDLNSAEKCSILKYLFFNSRTSIP